MRRTLSFLLPLALIGGAVANPYLNEFLVNGPGADNGDEFVELIGTPGQSLNGLWFLSIEGDATSQGTIDQAIDLSGLTFGANGLLLIRDTAGAYDSIIDPLTNVFTIDFAPDLENGSNTFALVQNYSGYVINQNTNAGQNNVAGQTDIDANNDGIIGDVANFDGSNPTNVLPWTSVVDAIGMTDAAGDWGYANQFGVGADFNLLNLLGPTSGSNPTGDAFVRLQDGTLVAADLAENVVGSNFGQFTALNGNVDAAWFQTQTYTPGAANPVPEPATMVALGLGAVALLKRKRKA